MWISAVMGAGLTSMFIEVKLVELFYLHVQLSELAPAPEVTVTTSGS